jgi:hypothetical protein
MCAVSIWGGGNVNICKILQISNIPMHTCLCSELFIILPDDSLYNQNM